MTETNLKFALSCEDLQKFQASGIAGPFRLLADHEVKPVLRQLTIAKARLFFWHRILSRSLLLKIFFVHMRTKVLKAKPGEFFIFFGQVWHSIENRSQRRRSAITFQYSPTRAKVKMPAAGYEFPFVWDSRPVPCCLVRGIDEYGRNLLVNAPLE
jgi:hypothetical protein